MTSEACFVSGFSAQDESDDRYGACAAPTSSVSASHGRETPNDLTVEDLPEELKLKILSYVPCKDLRGAVRQLNHLWKDLTEDDALWHRIEFEPNDPTDATVTVIRHFRNVIQSIRIPGHETLPEVLEATSHCRQLEELVVVPCTSGSLTILDLLWLRELSARLTALSLRGFSVPPVMKGHSLMRGFSSTLVSLDLSQCKGIDDDTMELIADCCPQLKLLDVDFVEELTDRSMVVISDKLPHIKALYIDGERISDWGFQVLLTKLRDLEAFGVSYARNLTGRNFLKLSKLPSLKYLKIRHGELLDARDFVRLFHITSFESMITVNFQYCDAFDEQAVKNIASSCPNLEWFITMFGEVDDEAVVALVDNCPKLKVLYLAGCWTITGRPWLSGIHEKLPHLQYIDFSMCSSLDADLLDDVARLHPTIVMVNYYETALNLCRDDMGYWPSCSFMEALSVNPSLQAVENSLVTYPNLISAVSKRVREEVSFGETSRSFASANPANAE